MVTLEQLPLLLSPFLDSDDESKGFRSGGEEIENTVATRISGTSGVARADYLFSSFKVSKVHWQLKHIEKILVKNSNLKSLPKEFCQLRSLKYLDLSGSKLLQMLPKSFGCLINLQHLDLSRSRALRMLSDSFGNLTRLKHLDLDCCFNLTLSEESFVNIRTLEYLKLSYCYNVGMLPSEVAHQPSLEYLYMFGTRLKELPGDIGNLSSLEVLELGSPLEMLPRSLGHLGSLKKLGLCDCRELKSLPNSLGLLTQLSTLEIKSCGIESLPPEVVKLNNLVTLRIESLPPEVVKLNNLVTLRVDDCPLRELPLKKVVEGETGVIELSRLEDIHLFETEISEISFSEGVCPSLRHLTIGFCNALVEVGSLPPALIKLSLLRCPRLTQMEGICNLTNLQEADIVECIEVEELPGLEKLISLKKLLVDGCSKLKRIRGLGQLSELRTLSVSSCVALNEIASVEDSGSLEKLNIAICPKLQWRRGVLEQLRQRLKGGLLE